MSFDRDGNLWTAGSGGVVKWNLADHVYTKYTVDNGLADNNVLSPQLALLSVGASLPLL